MNEKRALALLREDRPGGLDWFIDKYTAYVSAIAWNILGRTMTAQDVEEVTADVFVTLWRNRTKPRSGQVKGYLGSLARSRAINKLRQAGADLDLEDDGIALPGPDPETLVTVRERDETVRRAVGAMAEPDREIFVRHYYYCQTAAEIGDLLHMPAATVRQRLKRGRDRLRNILTEGDENYDRAYQ